MPELALDLERAPVRLDDAPGEQQSQPEPTGLPRPAPVAPEEWREEMLHVLWRNSRAVIPHLDGEQPTDGARDQLHLGRSPVLRGIGEQIVERAAQHPPVDFNLSAAAA